MQFHTELKERTYLLKGDSTPLSFIIASRHQKNAPFLFFDEEKKINREVRYARNQKSPFVDEQDDKAILEPIEFIDGRLVVPKDNPMLQNILSFLHPARDIKYYEFDAEKKAKEEMETLNAEVDALVKAKSLDIDTKESILRIMTESKVDSMTTSEINRDILMYAKRNPTDFLRAIDDPNLKLNNTISKAFANNVVVLKNNNKDIHFNLPTNKKKMITIPFGEEAHQALVSYCLTEEGVEILKMLEKQVN